MLLLQYFTKSCSKCKEIKTFSEFHKGKDTKIGLKSSCKICSKQYDYENKEAILNKKKTRYQQNKDNFLKITKEYYINNKQKISENKKKYSEINKEAINKQRKEFRDSNKEKIKEISAEYYKKNKQAICMKHKEYREINKDYFSEYNKKYNLENKESTSLRNKEYRRNNREQLVASSRKYYYENRKRLLHSKKQYVELNKDVIKEKAKIYSKTEFRIISNKNKNHKRRSISKSGDVSNQQLRELQNNAKICYWCGCKLNNIKVHIDHYIPLSKGGEHTLSNLVVSCARCNLSKSAKDPIIFAMTKGKLL